MPLVSPFHREAKKPREVEKVSKVTQPETRTLRPTKV